jgi:hypothetical protein
MATATAKTASETEVSELAQKIREQLVTTVQQAQKLSVEAAETWLKTASVLPVPDLPVIPGLPSLADVETVTTYTFDVASDLLSAQRDYALQLAKLLAPAKPASA